VEVTNAFLIFHLNTTCIFFFPLTKQLNEEVVIADESG